METKQHKHKGVEKEGYLRLHPITQQHKDKKVQQYHNASLGKKIAPIKQRKERTVERQTRNIQLPIDKEGFISLDLDTSGANGLRISCTRTERQNNKTIKRTVGLQIDNKPARELESGESFTNKRMTYNIQK